MYNCACVCLHILKFHVSFIACVVILSLFSQILKQVISNNDVYEFLLK